ncbi:hypothetical protein GQX73_g6384 [Xylaria multiplex]|uniref:Zn(2)-C6 fungal-type domain-containing protein n=1 Tax=Xylaria multiplex TaxID=323545 RepID=A0A7C8N362_9PEZI|nr:hypothetical protein GQX73_g6384 [Xylaria multiplex]
MDTTPSDGTVVTGAIRPTAWRRACVACTRAKRQCTKQVPRCRRCLEKGLQCTYPPPRRPERLPTAEADGQSLHPNSATLQLDESLLATPAGIANTLGMPGDSVFSFFQMAEADLESLALPTEVELPGGLPQAAVSSDTMVSLQGAWFLTPESWITEFTEPPPTTLRETEKSLRQYIEQVQSWMRQWVTEGHSPLHHRELYSFHMPRHTQDAYTAMAMYINKTSEAEATIHRILEDRVSQLLQDQAVETSLGNASGDGLSIFDHMSRVQTLLCYQLVRLFDGDIRMRGQAEALIPTLFLWNKQMLEIAKDSLEHPELFLVSSPFNVNLQSNTSQTAESSLSPPKVVWRAWIVAESVRRTWQITNIVQEVYQFFKRGWSECPGRLPSTMRRTLWDAPSAYSWARELKGGKNPLLVPLVGLEEILPRISPMEVDDFNMAAIGLYGMEKVDQWLEEEGPNKLPLLSGLGIMSHAHSLH